MNTKLTLNIDKRVISKAKTYAKKQGRSLSAMVESYLRVITSNEQVDESKILENASPRVKSLVGIAKKLPQDKDYKELITEYLTEKYLK